MLEIYDNVFKMHRYIKHLFCSSLQKGLYIVLSVHSTLCSAWRQACVDWTFVDQRTGETKGCVWKNVIEDLLDGITIYIITIYHCFLEYHVVLLWFSLKNLRAPWKQSITFDKIFLFSLSAGLFIWCCSSM